jgi:hypothetical protein
LFEVKPVKKEDKKKEDEDEDDDDDDGESVDDNDLDDSDVDDLESQLENGDDKSKKNIDMRERRFLSSCADE